LALDGIWHQAAAMIVVAAVIDGLVGRLARLLKATSRFGAEFDSLSDFLCFGVAPALILYMWTLHDLHGLGFMPCLMFAVCSALRLARFNASIVEEPGAGVPKPAYSQNFFTGVPAPAGAGLVLFPLFAGLEAKSLGLPGLAAVMQHPLVCASVLIGTAVLLVSTIPVWSFKNFRIPSQYVLAVLLGTGLFVALLIADPWAALAAGGLIYVGMIPLSLRSFRRLRRQTEEAQEPAGGNLSHEQA
jgi:CDP-diacylglycerol--serine O-phosphatidyltransferase